MHRLRSAPHHFSQQGDEQFGVQSTFIGAVPEATTRVHRRSCADRLALPGTLDDRCLAFLAPSLAVNSVGTKSRLIPEIHFTAASFGLPRNFREVFLPP